MKIKSIWYSAAIIYLTFCLVFRPIRNVELKYILLFSSVFLIFVYSTEKDIKDKCFWIAAGCYKKEDSPFMYYLGVSLKVWATLLIGYLIFMGE